MGKQLSQGPMRPEWILPVEADGWQGCIVQLRRAARHGRACMVAKAVNILLSHTKMGYFMLAPTSVVNNKVPRPYLPADLHQ